MQLIPDEDGNYDIHRVVYFLLDMETGKRERVLELEDGWGLPVTQGYPGSPVFADGRFFYAKHRDGMADIYVPDRNTGSSAFLFTDGPDITFRLFAAYSGGLSRQAQGSSGRHVLLLDL